MRVSPKQGKPHIAFRVDTTRPITMHICGTTYRMEANEAVEMANDLADAVEGLEKAEADVEAKIKTEQGE